VSPTEEEEEKEAVVVVLVVAEEAAPTKSEFGLEGERERVEREVFDAWVDSRSLMAVSTHAKLASSSCCLILKM
jgi:hypothetical protein